MAEEQRTSLLSRFSSELGMLVVLIVLCVYFSLATLDTQFPVGTAAGQDVADRVLAEIESPRVLLAVHNSTDGPEMAEAMQKQIEEGGGTVYATVVSPQEAGAELRKIAGEGQRLDAVLTSDPASKWGVWGTVMQRLSEENETFGTPEVLRPEGRTGSRFLTSTNLFSIGDQIAVIAIMAIGMTMVIITAGIDLSVGSLIALASVTAGLFIANFLGGTEASSFGMFAAGAAAIVACALVGLFSGAMITLFDVPPFIVTLAMMWSARGLAQWLTGGTSVPDIPDSYNWLGSHKLPLGLPLSVAVMLVLYVVAHFVMTQTTLGRYIYAVGGNPEAARLSGVPVKRVLLLVYTLSAALAGMGGIVLSSRLNTADPRLGVMQELYVIAAVVVGGTSLAGGEGRIPGTLIGALILGVISNGMGLLSINPFIQNIVLGQLLLVAVVFDQLKRGGRLSDVAKKIFRRPSTG